MGPIEKGLLECCLAVSTLFGGQEARPAVGAADGVWAGQFCFCCCGLQQPQEFPLPRDLLPACWPAGDKEELIKHLPIVRA